MEESEIGREIFSAGFFGLPCLMRNLRDLIRGMKEEEIIALLRKGDEKVFRELVESSQVRVRSICREIVRDREDAEDIAQEVFVEVYRSVGRFRADAKLFTWIYRIAVNKSLNHVRSKQRHKWLLPLEKLAGTLQEAEGAGTTASLPSAKLEEKQRKQRLHEAIDALPENQKKAFILSRIEGFSTREVAEIMETTVPGVESLLQRARVNLQKKLWACYKKGCL